MGAWFYGLVRETIAHIITQYQNHENPITEASELSQNFPLAIYRGRLRDKSNYDMKLFPFNSIARTKQCEERYVD